MFNIIRSDFLRVSIAQHKCTISEFFYLFYVLMFTHIRLQHHFIIIPTSEHPNPLFYAPFFTKIPMDLPSTYIHDIILTSLYTHMPRSYMPYQQCNYGNFFIPAMMILIHSPTMCKFSVRWWMNWEAMCLYIRQRHTVYVCVSILPLRIFYCWEPLHINSRHSTATQHSECYNQRGKRDDKSVINVGREN